MRSPIVYGWGGYNTGTITFTSSVGNISKIEINHSGVGQWVGNGDAGEGWPNGEYGYYEASGGKYIWNESSRSSVTLYGSGQLKGITSCIHFRVTSLKET